jgi:hypothetical protein
MEGRAAEAVRAAGEDSRVTSLLEALGAELEDEDSPTAARTQS